MRKLVYYVAVSLDGFIADDTGDATAFPQEPATLARLFSLYPETCPTHMRDLLGVTGDNRRFDTVLMGRNTVSPAVEAGLPRGAYPHLRQIVVSHSEVGEGVEHWSGDVAGAVAALKAEPGGDIWLCGGGHLAAQLIDHIDELALKVNPVSFGQGIRLFAGTHRPTRFTLDSCEVLPGGVLLNSLSRPRAPRPLPASHADQGR